MTAAAAGLRRRLLTMVTLVLAVTVVGGVAGCAGEVDPPGASRAPALNAVERAQARAALADPGRFPGLSGRATALGVADLAQDAEVADLDETLAGLGYRGGVERVLNGRSRSLTGVTSRVLVFADEEGARGFVTLVRDQADAYFGFPTASAALRVGDRSGWRFQPPVCDCPKAEPLHVGVVPSGTVVAWLGITGPQATAEELARLLAATESR